MSSVFVYKTLPLLVMLTLCSVLIVNLLLSDVRDSHLYERYSNQWNGSRSALIIVMDI